MSEMPERIWADERCGYMFTKSLITPCTEYIRADIVVEKDERIAFLEKVADEAIGLASRADLMYAKMGVTPLAAWLRENGA